MRKYIAIFLMFGFAILGAQEKETANRFFYELTFKPGITKDSLIKEVTILDITPKKSIYRDYLMVSQDSTLKVYMENAMKTGNFSMKSFEATFQQPKFSYSVSKTYPAMDIKYTDNILQDKMSYEEKVKFNWKIGSEKMKIGEYNAQKATTTFGGRNWVAWFSIDLPFPDGPYKFHGLPGLIVKLEDDKKHYSWELKGNKKIENYEEESYSDKLSKQFGQGRNAINVSREKYEQVYNAYRKDPFGSIRVQLAQIPPDFKLQDGTLMSQLIKEQEEKLKKYLSENDNAIEIPEPKAKK